jgi:hypothetical protein
MGRAPAGCAKLTGTGLLGKLARCSGVDNLFPDAGGAKWSRVRRAGNPTGLIERVATSLGRSRLAERGAFDGIDIFSFWRMGIRVRGHDGLGFRLVDAVILDDE